MSIDSIGSQLRTLQAIKAQNTTMRRHCEAPQEPKQSINKPETEWIASSSPTGSPRNDNKVQELRNFAQTNNMTDIEDEDIQYALKYGTSLFADYSA